MRLLRVELKHSPRQQVLLTVLFKAASEMLISGAALLKMVLIRTQEEQQAGVSLGARRSSPRATGLPHPLLVTGPGGFCDVA